MNAITVLSAITARLEHLLDEESDHFEGIETRLEDLVSELKLIKRRILDSDPKQRETHKILALARQVVRRGHAVEDFVESYAKGPAVGLNGTIRSIFRTTSLSNIHAELDKQRTQVRDLSDRVKFALKSNSTKKLPGLNLNRLSFSHRDPDWPVKDFPATENEILQDLFAEDESRVVISIWGMTGTGKTPFVKRIFDHIEIRRRFQGLAWISVPAEFQPRDIWLAILLQLLPKRKEIELMEQEEIQIQEVFFKSKEEIMCMENMELVSILSTVQEYRKCLIVLEDLRGNAWERMDLAFPFDNSQSKVVVTTRMWQVAAELAEAAGGKVYKMPSLAEHESRALFKKTAEIGDREMKMIPSAVFMQCEGSPLLLVILAQCWKRNKAEVKTILHDLAPSPINGLTHEEGTRTVLHVSYSCLSPTLKPCFLYLGNFPEGQDIEADKLYLLWMAEGFISPRGGESMDVAEHYLNELALRNMVEVHEDEVSIFRRYKSCQLRDIVQELCLEKAKEEEFFETIEFGQGNEIGLSTSRVAIYLNKCKEGDFVGLSIQKIARQIRSLFLFDTHGSLPKSVSPRGTYDLKDFEGLRVLDFNGVDFRVRKLPRGIEKLVYLRYLGFRGCYLLELPLYVSNLSFLETLDLRVRHSCKMTIPNVIWKMSRLRHLYFPQSYESVRHEKIRLDGLSDLKILENFNTLVCHAGDLLKLNNLQILTTIGEGNNLKELQQIMECVNRNSKHLRWASIGIRNFDCYSQDRRAILSKLMGCHALHALQIEGHIHQLPTYDLISHNFVEMVFNGSELKGDAILTLSKLANLRSLELCNDAFVGKEMVFPKSSFPELRSLKLLDLHNLRIWRVEEGAMPELSTLTIVKCSSLTSLADGLTFALNLKKLKIGSMPRAFKDRIQGVDGEEGKDFDKVKHVSRIIFDADY